MISEENKGHKKHADLNRSSLGFFARNEMSIIGSNCSVINEIAALIIEQLSSQWKIAYVDAEHGSAVDSSIKNAIPFLSLTEKLGQRTLDFKGPLNEYDQKFWLNDADLVLVNGNHFDAESQILIIDPAKPIEKKFNKLTNVKLILLKDEKAEIPELVKTIQGFSAIPVLSISDRAAIATFVEEKLTAAKPKLKGLVLAGGESRRMGRDKGLLHYHRVDQRLHLKTLLEGLGIETFISVNGRQTIPEKNAVIEDKFIGLGPISGILSAFQHDPNAAWLTIACDLPYISSSTFNYLITNRNPSKGATCFYDPKREFPEPLVTIWEPKSYLRLLQFLSLGYSCPRKVLINSDVEILRVPDSKELLNVNYPDEYEQVVSELQHR